MQLLRQVNTVYRLHTAYLIAQYLFDFVGLQMPYEVIGMGYFFQRFVLLLQFLYFIFGDEGIPSLKCYFYALRGYGFSSQKQFYFLWLPPYPLASGSYALLNNLYILQNVFHYFSLS